MASLTKATRSFLVNRHRETSIFTLHLKIYPINTFLCEVGPLVSDTVESGLLKELDLAILDKIDLWESNFEEEDMLQRAQNIDNFFSIYPIVLHCLTRLSLYNVRIDKLDMHHLLLESCKQLKHLGLSRCDTGDHSLFTIDAPNSKLCVLELTNCRFERLELVCLPKLEKLRWDTWVSHNVPLTFDFIPSLRELEFVYDATFGQRELKLSELLHGTTCIHTLTLDFVGENRQWYPERRTPHWEMHFGGSKNSLLKELEFIGFRSLQHQFTFIRSILERAPNMQRIVLKGDEQCENCDALDTPPRLSKFPKKNEEQEIVVKRIRDGIFSTQIFFDE
uniref:F-box/LRR-repeat protein 15/At3g58940/PEG3-like LRR domain-containing protein n=1 Tax=Aegilops tauschii TaxID=37682 RepID=M8CFU2_AEGTA